MCDILIILLFILTVYLLLEIVHFILSCIIEIIIVILLLIILNQLFVFSLQLTFNVDSYLEYFKTCLHIAYIHASYKFEIMLLKLQIMMQ